MKLLNNYNDYILDLILEDYSKDEITLILSDNLENIISKIDHPIANKLLMLNNGTSYKSKITVLDIDENVRDNEGNKLFDRISFMSSNKVIDKTIEDLDLITTNDNKLSPYEYLSISNHIKDNKTLFTNSQRSSTSLGRIIIRLFPNEFVSSGRPGNDIESLVNTYKALRNNNNELFEIVNGSDIIHWYNKNNYKLESGGSLLSCMSDENCSNFLYFYSENPEKVSLLILKDSNDDTKITGRAILWNLDMPENRIFMDRIYYINDYEIEIFKNYAKKNGWLYKKDQDYDERTPIIDSKNNNIVTDLIINDFNDTEVYPYLDTLKYFYGSNLSNNINNAILINSKEEEVRIKFLISTDGDYDLIYMKYSEFYKKYVKIHYGMEYCKWSDDYRYDEDCYYSNYYNLYISEDYAKENMVECDVYSQFQDRFRKEGDYFYDGTGKKIAKQR